MYLHCSRLTLCLFLVFIIDFSSLFLHVSPVFHLLPHLFTFYTFPIFYSDCISFPCFILFFLISLPPCLFLLNHIFSPFFFSCTRFFPVLSFCPPACLPSRHPRLLSSLLPSLLSSCGGPQEPEGHHIQQQRPSHRGLQLCFHPDAQSADAVLRAGTNQRE